MSKDIPIKLLTCPFCGKEPHMWNHKLNVYIDCETEDCINPGTPIGLDKLAAVSMWNTRREIGGE